MSRYDNNYGRFELTYADSGDVSSAAAELQLRKNITWPLEVLMEILAGTAMDGTLYAGGFLVSIGAGLSVDVAAGTGFIEGLVIYASGSTNKASLPDDTATIYLYLKETATTKEVYCLEARKFGIKKNRERVLIRFDKVISISALNDIIEY